jgi:hypothetical protein
MSIEDLTDAELLADIARLAEEARRRGLSVCTSCGNFDRLVVFFDNDGQLCERCANRRYPGGWDEGESLDGWLVKEQS